MKEFVFEIKKHGAMVEESVVAVDKKAAEKEISWRHPFAYYIRHKKVEEKK